MIASGIGTLVKAYWPRDPLRQAMLVLLHRQGHGSSKSIASLLNSTESLTDNDGGTQTQVRQLLVPDTVLSQYLLSRSAILGVDWQKESTCKRPLLSATWEARGPCGSERGGCGGPLHSVAPRILLPSCQLCPSREPCPAV